MCLLADRALLVQVPLHNPVLVTKSMEPSDLALNILHRYTLPWKRSSYRMLPVEVYYTFCSLWRGLGDWEVPKLVIEEMPEKSSCPFFGDQCWIEKQLLFDPTSTNPITGLRVLCNQSRKEDRDTFEPMPWVTCRGGSCANLENKFIFLPHAWKVQTGRATINAWKRIVVKRNVLVDRLSRATPSPDDMLTTEEVDICTYPFGESNWSWSNCFVPTTK